MQRSLILLEWRQFECVLGLFNEFQRQGGGQISVLHFPDKSSLNSPTLKGLEGTVGLVGLGGTPTKNFCLGSTRQPASPSSFVPQKENVGKHKEGLGKNKVQAISNRPTVGLVFHLYEKWRV